MADFGIGETAVAAGAAEGTAASGVSLATLASYASLASAAAGVVSGITGAENSAKATADAASFNAETAANNATIANQNAASAAQAGEVQAGASSQKTRASVGAILANQAASGVDVDSGSAVDVRSSAASLGELDAINIRSNAARQAYTYQNQAVSQTSQAELDQASAQSAEESGEINSATTLLGGVSSGAANYAKFLQSGSL